MDDKPGSEPGGGGPDGPHKLGAKRSYSFQKETETMGEGRFDRPVGRHPSNDDNPPVAPQRRTSGGGSTGGGSYRGSGGGPDLTSCIMCSSIFSTPTRVLICQHYFCETCLSQRAASTPEIVCPLCSQITRIPNVASGVSSLPTNEAINGLVEAKRTHYAMEKCSAHDRKMKFVCERCAVAVCSSCAVDEHKGHPMTNQEEILSLIGLVETRKAVVAHSAFVAWEQVTHHFQKLREAIDARERVLLSQLYQGEKSLLAALSSLAKDMQQLAVSGHTRREGSSPPRLDTAALWQARELEGRPWRVRADVRDIEPLTAQLAAVGNCTLDPPLTAFSAPAPPRPSQVPPAPVISPSQAQMGQPGHVAKKPRPDPSPHGSMHPPHADQRQPIYGNGEVFKNNTMPPPQFEPQHTNHHQPPPAHNPQGGYGAPMQPPPQANHVWSNQNMVPHPSEYSGQMPGGMVMTSNQPQHTQHPVAMRPPHPQMTSSQSTPSTVAPMDQSQHVGHRFVYPPQPVHPVNSVHDKPPIGTMGPPQTASGMHPPVPPVSSMPPPPGPGVGVQAPPHPPGQVVFSLPAPTGLRHPIGHMVPPPQRQPPLSKKPRVRRTNQQLQRDFACTYPGCGRMYASQRSLVQHRHIKHPDWRHEHNEKIPMFDRDRKMSTSADSNGDMDGDGSETELDEGESDHHDNHYPNSYAYGKTGNNVSEGEGARSITSM